jgi:CheY-like chemotaxis protein
VASLHTILVADDEPDLRELIATYLAEAGYAVLTASHRYEPAGILADDWVNLLESHRANSGHALHEDMRSCDGLEIRWQHLAEVLDKGFRTQQRRRHDPAVERLVADPHDADVLLEIGIQHRVGVGEAEPPAE